MTSQLESGLLIKRVCSLIFLGLAIVNRWIQTNLRGCRQGEFWIQPMYVDNNGDKVHLNRTLPWYRGVCEWHPWRGKHPTISIYFQYSGHETWEFFSCHSCAESKCLANEWIEMTSCRPNSNRVRTLSVVQYIADLEWIEVMQIPVRFSRVKIHKTWGDVKKSHGHKPMHYAYLLLVTKGSPPG